MGQSAAHQLHGKNQWGAALSVQDGKTFRGFNPKTHEWLEPAFCQAAGGEIDAARALAQESALALRRTNPETIAAFLETAAEEKLALGDFLIECEARICGRMKDRVA